MNPKVAENDIYTAYDYDLAELNISKERLYRLSRAIEETAKVMLEIISNN